MEIIFAIIGLVVLGVFVVVMMEKHKRKQLLLRAEHRQFVDELVGLSEGASWEPLPTYYLSAKELLRKTFGQTCRSCPPMHGKPAFLQEYTTVQGRILLRVRCPACEEVIGYEVWLYL